LAVITGAPGSGKTTLGWELSRLLHVPLVSRDAIKTGLHVTGERRHGEVELARPA
jgi:predicted kinase